MCTNSGYSERKTKYNLLFIIGALFLLSGMNTAVAKAKNTESDPSNVLACPVITTQPRSTTVCSGTSATFSVTIAPGSTVTYQWQRNGVNIPGATSRTYSTPATIASNNGSLYRVIINSNGCSPLASSNALLTVNTPPTITTQPVNRTVCQGSTNTFTVVATGTNLTYQWTRNGININGATSASYTTPILTTANDNDRYRVIISNSGCTSVTSARAILRVNAPATITSQPRNSTVCLGARATFSVTATGNSLTYQWRKNGVNISGATARTYTTPVTTNADNGALYSVVVTTAGCASVVSSNAILTIGSTTVITTQPQTQSVCTGRTATFTIVATGTNLTYQWRRNGANIAGATSASYTTPATTSSNNLNQYTVIVSSACGTTVSSTAVLYVNNTPAITVQPSNTTTCLGSTATFSVTATGNNLRYQWRKNGVNISGANSATYTTPATLSTDNGSIYSVIVTSCTSTTSSNATLSLNSLPVITNQPVSRTSVVGGSATFSVSATGTGLTYQWQKNGANIAGATGTSYTINPIIAGSAGNYTVRITNSNNCRITSNVAVLTVTVTNQWSGGTSSDWFSAANWSGGIIPNLNLDVTIPAGLSRYPVITGTATVRNIIISNGATLQLDNNANLAVHGDFVNSGTFTSSINSTVNFVGTTIQTISGTNAISFQNLTISNALNIVRLNTSASLINTLTLGPNAQFHTTGYSFTIISNSNGTGRIAAVPGSASIVGNINMQRYIPAQSGRYWYHVSSAVANGTVQMWQDGAPTTGIYITGPFEGASNPGLGINATGVSCYSWNASTSTWTGFPKASNQELVVRGQGYRIFVRDGGSSATTTTEKTLSLTGTPNVGNQVFTLAHNSSQGAAGGWNMLGNPYPSNIDGNLNNAAWINKTNLDGNATYIWDADAKTYLSCNGGIGACIIPSSQAFWVKVRPGGGSITSTENTKVASTSVALYDAISPTYIPVKLIHGNGSGSDITYIRFENDAFTSFDEQYDAYKLSMNAENVMYLSSISDTTEYSIQARPIPNRTSDTIDLKISGPEGNHILDFSERTNLSDDYQLFLIDSYNGNVINLNLQPVYAFDIISGIYETTVNRFKLVFSYEAKTTTSISTVPTSVSGVEVYPNPVRNNEFYIADNNTSENITVKLTDLSGRTVFTKTYNNDTTLYVQLSQKLPAGTYIVETISGELLKRSKIVIE